MHRKPGYVLLSVCVLLTVVIVLTSCIFKLALEGIKKEGLKVHERNSFNITEKEEEFILKLEKYINTNTDIKEKIISGNTDFIAPIRFDGDNVMQAIFNEKYVVWKSYKDFNTNTYNRIAKYELVSKSGDTSINLNVLNRLGE